MKFLSDCANQRVLSRPGSKRQRGLVLSSVCQEEVRMIELDWTMLTLSSRPLEDTSALIVITKQWLLQMNETLSASGRGGNDAYYEYSPLGIFYDSQPVQYNHERNVNFVLPDYPGFVIETPSPANRPAHCSAYLPYQFRAPALMDLDLLSAENYQEVPYDHRFSEQHDSSTIQTYGGFLARGTPETQVPSSTTNMTTRKSSRKGILKSASAEETATRQRGRPRLDNRDQTAGEVCLRIS